MPNPIARTTSRLAVLLLAAVVAPAAAQSPAPAPPRPPGGVATGPPIVSSYAAAMVSAPPDALGLDPFYRKYADAFGIPIVSSEKVDDAALLMARDIVNYMLLKRPDVREAMISRHSRLLVMDQTEGETDLPERRDWKKPAIDDRRLTPGERATYNAPNGIANMTDKQYWDGRARGMGGTITSCAEENLLGIPGTRYYGEHITVHEFSHNIMGALRMTDPALHADIQTAYDAAKARGLYRDAAGREQYAINTPAEYFAEGSQWWFWSNIEFYDGTTGARVQSPDDLKAYDPALYGILERVYAGHHIPADVYYGKNLRPARAPEASAPLSIGDTFTLTSATLSETRRINVYLPPAYTETPTTRLPVLYMPDGGMAEDFLHVAGLLQVLTGNGTMRPFILVGIENIERRRDLTGPTDNPEDRKIAPRVGGSPAFRTFIRRELMPAVRARYRTTAETAIVGESLAGLFVVETCLREPDLFKTCIAFDPSLWWNNGGLVKTAPEHLRASRERNRTIYLAISSQGDVDQTVSRMAAILASDGGRQLTSQLVTYPTELHSTIYHPAALAAFRDVFKPSQ